MCCQLPSDSVKSVAQFKATQEEVDNRLLFYSAASTDYKSIVITSVDDICMAGFLLPCIGDKE